MNNSIKQIYASLQIEENQIKVLVAEYFNTRFNIIRVEKARTNAVSGFKIADKEQFVLDVKAVLDNAAKKIGVKIEKVILVIPAYNFKRFPLSSSVNTTKGYADKEDVARALTNALKNKVDDDVMVVNAAISKYTINGITYRRLPEKEVCNSMQVDIDLLCADAQMVYEYVEVIEKAGLEILDICLDTYAIAKEASLIGESSKKNVILLDIHNYLTYLVLFSKGKLVSTELIYDGLINLTNPVYGKYHFNEDVIMRLLKYSVDYSDKDECIIYAWNNNDKQESITNKELSALVLEPLNNYVDKLISMCKPIIEAGEVEIFVTGDGQEMKALVNKIVETSGVVVKPYYPDTIGVRDSNLTALYGSLVAYHEKAVLNNLNVSCVDLLEYDSVIDHRKLDNDGATLTTKIKRLFSQYMSKEEE